MAGAAAIAFCAAGLLGRAPSIRGEARPNEVLPVDSGASVRNLGVAGCASSACHGGPASDSLSGILDSQTWASSATHWLAVDPHTKAYAALESSLADKIMSRMHLKLKATDDARCLACHTNPALAEGEATPHEQALRKEGVGCESCHGSASKWLHSHTTWTAESRSSGYQQNGMTKLFDLGERALTCAGCHVGAPADPARGSPVRDMNHDMIAAGHPRLNFDFADYQRRLPPHWFERDRTSGLPIGPGFEVKAWLVGCVAYAEADLLLRSDRDIRAKRNDPHTPWPEFSEWSCVSCHHKLADNFPSSIGKPALQTIWPSRSRIQAGGASKVGTRFAPIYATLSENDCREVVKDLLKSVNAESLDHDRACRVYHGLAAWERMRMKLEGRTEPDATFVLLAKNLTTRRGNLDTTVKPEARDQLKLLLGRLK